MNERNNHKLVNIIFGTMVLILGTAIVFGAVVGYFLLTQPKLFQGSQGDTLVHFSPKPTFKPSFDAKVIIAKSGFSPLVILVSQGSQITWNNQDQISHSLSSSSLPDFSTDTPLKPNDSYSFIFEKKGTFDYYDSLNKIFKGIIVVK